MNPISRAWYRHRVNKYLAVLFYPMSSAALASAVEPVAGQYMETGEARKWTCQTTATIIATVITANVVRSELDLRRREKCVEQIRDSSPSTLVDELKWGAALKRGDVQAKATDPVVFRFNFINAILANWLVNEKSIDLHTKSAFVTCVAQALTSVDAQTMNETLENLTANIGKAAQSG